MFKEHWVEFIGNDYKFPGCGSEYVNVEIHLSTEKITIVKDEDDNK